MEAADDFDDFGVLKTPELILKRRRLSQVSGAIFANESYQQNELSILERYYWNQG